MTPQTVLNYTFIFQGFLTTLLSLSVVYMGLRIRQHERVIVALGECATRLGAALTAARQVAVTHKTPVGETDSPHLFNQRAGKVI